VRIDLAVREKIRSELKRWRLWDGPRLFDALLAEHARLARRLDDNEGQIKERWPARDAIRARIIRGEQLRAEETENRRKPLPGAIPESVAVRN
jgi:hypothetical protein